MIRAESGSLARRDFLAGSVAFAALLGAGPAWAQLSSIAPFSYRAPQAALDDLKQRLARTRWPERETVSDWSQGVPLAKMRALVDYWHTGYDWRRCEAALARIPQFRTTIDGLGIHFIHARSKHDSPAGQAAWIYEKFHAWTDNKGDPQDALTRDQMLDNITLYWLTDTSASSARIYAEHAELGQSGNAGVVEMPVGVSMFPREIFPAPREWAERFFPKLIYWNEPERGGHFAAFEEPVLFTREMRALRRR